jgi:hypothetical protein
MTSRTHKQHSAAETVPEYLARIGTKGGTAGTGTAKRRTAAHYRRIQQMSAQARKRNGKEPAK